MTILRRIINIFCFNLFIYMYFSTTRKLFCSIKYICSISIANEQTEVRNQKTWRETQTTCSIIYKRMQKLPPRFTTHIKQVIKHYYKTIIFLFFNFPAILLKLFNMYRKRSMSNLIPQSKCISSYLKKNCGDLPREKITLSTS